MNSAAASATDPVDHDPSRRLRWGVYTLLIAVALGQAAGKILAVNSVDLQRLERQRVEGSLAQRRAVLEARGLAPQAIERRIGEARPEIEEKLRLQRPFLSGNDRSRWLAIRALAETGSFEIDPLLEEPTWDTIDMVQHRGRDGELHLYSSKPPLLMALIARPYWLLTQLTGTTLGESPYLLGRTLLLVINGGSLLLLLTSVAWLIERFGRGDIDRLFAMTAASTGTQLSAFTPVLNNHLIAAAAAGVACAAWARLREDATPRPGLSLLVGVAAAFATAIELPALSLLVLLALSLFRARPKETLCWFTPGALVVALAFFATNQAAHNDWRPPYAHRNTAEPEENWYDFEYTTRGKTRDSYWRNPKGIDRGEASKATYALHVLVGHHGIFSLTPVWLLSLVGVARLLATRDAAARELAWVSLLVTAACLVFYIGLRPQGDRNYGGMTSGFRWLFWVAPLWLACLPAGVERLARSRLGVALAATLLAFSVMSASYPTWNPWTQPWIYRWMEHLGFTVI